MNVLKRGWIPLLIVVVVAMGGFTVDRVRGVFASNNEITSTGAGLANDAAPFNPKRVMYEIFGRGRGAGPYRRSVHGGAAPFAGLP
jgi:hypothetical protein